MSGKKAARRTNKKKAARRRERRASSSAAAVAALDDDDHDVSDNGISNNHGGDDNGISSNQRAPKGKTKDFLSREEFYDFAEYQLRKSGLINAPEKKISEKLRGRMKKCSVHRKAELTEYIPPQAGTVFVDEAKRALIKKKPKPDQKSSLTEFVVKRHSKCLMKEKHLEAFVEQELTTTERQEKFLSLGLSSENITGVKAAFVSHIIAIVNTTGEHVHDALAKMDAQKMEDGEPTKTFEAIANEILKRPNLPKKSAKAKISSLPLEQNAPTAGAASKNLPLASSTSYQQQHGIGSADERNSTTANDATLRAELDRLQGELSAVTQRFEASRDESALQQQVRELQAELKRVSDKNVVLEATLKRVRGKNKVQARTIVYLQNQLEASQDSDSYDSNDSDYSNDRLEQVPDSDSFDDGWPSSPVSRTQTETSPTFQESGGSTDTIETPPKNSPARTPRPAGSSQSSEFGDSQSLSSGQALVRGRGGVDNQEGSERGLFPNAGNDDWGAAVLGDSFSTLGGDADVFSDDSQTAAPNATLYSTSLAMDRTAKASVSALQWIETGYASSPSTAAGSPASIAAREGAYSASSTSASEEVPVTSHASPFAAPRSPDSADTSTAYLEGSGGSVVEGEQDSSVPGLEEESEAGGDDIGSNFFSDDGSEQSKQKTKQDGPPAYIESGIFDGRRKMVHVEGSPQTVNVTAENPRRKLSVYDPKEKCKHEPF